jgi:Uma2 family endonuclease
MTVGTLESPPSPRLTKALVRITTDQYHQMIEQGIIPEDSSTELLDGLIVTKDRSDWGDNGMGHSPDHILVVTLLGSLASRINGPTRHLKIQLPICVAPHNEPEPDAYVARGTPRDYQRRVPVPADVLCVFEVSGSSLERDANEKLETYAATAIPQYIIINLVTNQVESYTRPDVAARTYVAKSVVSKGQAVRILLDNGEYLDVAAADLLP